MSIPKTRCEFVGCFLVPTDRRCGFSSVSVLERSLEDLLEHELTHNHQMTEPDQDYVVARLESVLSATLAARLRQ